MAFMRCLLEYPRITALPQDTQTCTFHFQTPTGTALAAAVLFHPLLTAWVQDYDGLMSDDVFTTTATATYYDLEDPEVRVPVHDDTIALTLSTAVSLPTENALVFSFQAAPESGANAKRRRGRIYAPTPTANALETVGGRVRLADATLSAQASNFADFVQSTVAADCRLSVYSPTTFAETESLADAFFLVDNGWVDGELDTQRRRGNKVATRIPWQVV